MKTENNFLSRNFPIDLVYLWVDGNDPKWRVRHDYYKHQIEPSNRDAQIIADARWRNNDELRYSLRSVERYAPWINHIYIVTDNQCPEWLNLCNGKISIVDHSEILPTDALPTYSSNAIENSVYKIHGLSEHFLFANDDMLFCRAVTPDMFFTPDGRSIVRLGRYNRIKCVHHGNYIKKVWHMQELVRQLTGRLIPYSPHHNIDAYRRSDIELCTSLLHDEWLRTTYRRFRHDDNMHRSFIGYYTIATGRAKMRRVGRYNQIYGLIPHLQAFFLRHFAYDSRRIQVNHGNFDDILRRYNPLMICINDNERTTKSDCHRMVAFLQNLFPDKCAFEI